MRDSVATGVSIIDTILLPSSISDFYVTLSYKLNDSFENEDCQVVISEKGHINSKKGQKAPKTPNTRQTHSDSFKHPALSKHNIIIGVRGGGSGGAAAHPGLKNFRANSVFRV